MPASAQPNESASKVGMHSDTHAPTIAWIADGYWLGRQDSNLGMAESKSAALPLGYAPSAPRGGGPQLYSEGNLRAILRAKPCLPAAAPAAITRARRTLLVGTHRGVVPAD